MRRHVGLAIAVAAFSLGVVAAQTPIVTGDRSTPLRALTGTGNAGISNAVLRDQPEIRVIRVQVEPAGTRAMHAHNDVKFHMFIPISGPMKLDFDSGQSVDVPAWQPYYMKAGTQHGFHNTSSGAVEIMEVFVK